MKSSRSDMVRANALFHSKSASTTKSKEVIPQERKPFVVGESLVGENDRVQ